MSFPKTSAVDATVTSPDHALAAFACPFSGNEVLYNRLLDLIQHSHIGTIIDTFVEMFSFELRSASSGLLETLSRCKEQEPRFDELWSSAVTGIGACVRGEEANPVRAAVELAFDLSRGGIPSSWSVKFEKPTPLRLGRRMLPEVVEVWARSGPCQIDLRILTQSGARLEFTDDVVSNSAPWALPAVQSGRCLVLSRNNLPIGCELPEHIVTLVADANEAEVFLSQLADSFDLLMNISVAHHRWVDRLIRQVIAVRAEPTVMYSGSNTAWPGIIYLSGAKPWVMAENLVHEASHQHFHIATRVAPVTAAEHKELYYSPFVKRPRPLEAIAFAFHAFGNARLFLEACSSHPVIDPSWLSARKLELDKKLVVTWKHLDSNPALSPAGYALVSPVSIALTQISSIQCSAPN